MNNVMKYKHVKKLALFSVCVLQTLVFKSQVANYISNGSMEDRYDCNFPNAGRKAKYWRGLDSLADAIEYSSTCYGSDTRCFMFDLLCNESEL